MAVRVLVVSPIPTHPQDQGNSARIFAVGKMLQAAGIIVHFLYYQLEGLAANQRAEMEMCWDYFHPVATSSRSMSPAGDGVYGLDDWWDPCVAPIAARLHKRWHFNAVIANYVWFSKVLESFGPEVLKILDTHDVFGGRADRFVGAGLVPEWFYTSMSEELRGLQRADVVLAIQREEAMQFRDLGHRDVRVLGHISQSRIRMPRASGDEPLTIGYFASGNPINVHSMERFRSRVLELRHDHICFVVAGSICDKLSAADLQPFAILGRVEHPDEFYDVVDVVINPMVFGTGLKIKSVESIFQGIPLVATTAAMTDLPTSHGLHALPSPEEVAERVCRLTRADLPELARASRRSAEQYLTTVRADFRDLLQRIKSHSPRQQTAQNTTADQRVGPS